MWEGRGCWQDCRESKSLFPQGKVICKGIEPKSVTKGKMQSGGGEGAKMEETDRTRVEMRKPVMGVLIVYVYFLFYT